MCDGVTMLVTMGEYQVFPAHTPGIPSLVRGRRYQTVGIKFPTTVWSKSRSLAVIKGLCIRQVLQHGAGSGEVDLSVAILYFADNKTIWPSKAGHVCSSVRRVLLV